MSILCSTFSNQLRSFNLKTNWVVNVLRKDKVLAGDYSKYRVSRLRLRTGQEAHQGGAYVRLPLHEATTKERILVHRWATPPLSIKFSSTQLLT